MFLAKSMITKQKKNLTPEQKKTRLDKRYKDDSSEYTIGHCWSAFIVNRQVRGNTEASIC